MSVRVKTRYILCCPSPLFQPRHVQQRYLCRVLTPSGKHVSLRKKNSSSCNILSHPSLSWLHRLCFRYQLFGITCRLQCMVLRHSQSYNTWTYMDTKYLDHSHCLRTKTSHVLDRSIWSVSINSELLPCDLGVKQVACKQFSVMTPRCTNDEEDVDTVTEDTNSDEEENVLLQPLAKTDLFTDEYLEPVGGHKILVIYPVLKRRHRIEDGSGLLDHHLSESVALVHCLPGWSVVDNEIVNLKQFHSARLFTKGVHARVCDLVRNTRNKTAVFVNISMLTGLQLSTLQRAWSVPVYDRYTIILQIFRLRARTREAKLQVALAELPYYRSRLRGMHEGSLDQQRGGLNYIGGSGESWMDQRVQVLSEKEKAIHSKLELIRSRRDLIRQERKKKEVPVVAVVGYTNAGKTSLIKTLTGESSLQPLDRLFATLDVTCYAGYLGNHMKVVYIDTVGFISDIPTGLIESFKATLEDIIHADVIIHVRDISHPETDSQNLTVLRTLKSLKLDSSLLETVVEVRNKADLIDGRPDEGSDEDLYISTVTNEGIPDLVQSLERRVIANTSRLMKRLKIPMAGEHLNWLHKEATVTDTRSCDDDSECLLVDTIMTKSAYKRFVATFGKRKKRRNKMHYNDEEEIP